jgi:O-Antigen ligase
MTTGPETRVETTPRHGADAAAAPAPRRTAEPAAVLLLATLGAVWSWWAVKSGGFFGTVLLPGTVALCAVSVLLVWTASWRGRLRKSVATIATLVSLTALGGWAALSAAWSPAPDAAIADGQRILAYALAFGLGVWLCNLLGDRMHLSFLPLAIAGAFAGTFVVVSMLTNDHPSRFLEVDGTLEFPFGYRNANAAFFAIAFWPALGLASRRETDWRLRAMALAAATLCLDLAMLCQSRGALLAGAASLCVYVLFARDRARRLGWLALAALPALLTLPALSDLYQAANAGGPLRETLGELRGAARAVALTAALSLVLGAATALLGRRLPASPRRIAIANRAALMGIVLAVLGGSIAFAAAAGNPLDWLGQRVGQFQSGKEAHLTGQATRFSLNAATTRGELWRVALLDAGNRPLLGDGGGGYRYHYLRERHANSPVAVNDAHSVELEILSELGVPGLALFVCAIGAAGVGAMRARRAGTDPAWLSITAVTAGTYWLVHTSVDWFWPYAAITAPVLGLLGAACAPALGLGDAAPRGHGRRLLGVGAVVLAVSALPPYLSERYVGSAYDEWPSNPTRAYDDLDRARSLNPLSIDPILAEGAIARAEGDERRAIRAFREAAEERPEEWAAHYLLARLYARRSPGRARGQIAIAHRQDPHNPDVAALRERLSKG